MESIERPYYIAEAVFGTMRSRYFFGYWFLGAFRTVELFAPGSADIWCAAHMSSSFDDGLSVLNFCNRLYETFQHNCVINQITDKTKLPRFGAIDFDRHEMRSCKEHLEHILLFESNFDLVAPREPIWNL